MTDPKHHLASSESSEVGRKSSGGGVFIALGAIIGVLAGGFMGQPSAGLLAGLFVGALAAVILWLKER